MTKRLKLNLGLLFVIVGLTAVIYFEPGAKKVEKPVTLLSLSADQVDKIQLQRGSTPAITIEREDAGWMIVAPIRIAASEYRVDKLLKLMTAKSHSHYPASAQPLAVFGLDAPLGKVSFNGQSILFGADEMLNRRRYVLVEGQVHLINGHYFYQSQLLLTALVDKALLPQGATLQKITLPGLILQRDQTDWQLLENTTSEIETVSSMDDINAFVDVWRFARATQVSRYQSDVTEATIELVFADSETMELEILAREPELILGRRELGLRYHFGAEQRDHLLVLARSSSSPELIVDSIQ